MEPQPARRVSHCSGDTRGGEYEIVLLDQSAIEWPWKDKGDLKARISRMLEVRDQGH